MTQELDLKRVCLYSVAYDGAIAQKDNSLHEQLAVIQLINNTPNWKYERLYMDPPGMRTSFDEMIADCNAGKYDIIVTKSVRSFAKTLVETLAVATRLAGQNPPVEIIFTDEAIFTLDADKMDDLRQLINDTCREHERAESDTALSSAFIPADNGIDENANEEGE